MRRFLSTLFLLFVALSAFAADPVDKLAADTIAAWKFPGVAIAIVQNDKVVYLEGFGVTPDTLFEIASDTKAFTATAMAMLVDEKKLDWDDPVHNSVEYFHLDDPCADSMVTIRDILSHRTGLARHDELWDYTDWSREQVIRAIGKVPLTKSFRSAYQYQNIMFALAGEVVASASKMSWHDFIRTRIFEPLGMTESRSTMAEWNASPHTTGYRWDAAAGRMVVQPMRDYENIAPAGTVMSSARDMAQWLRFQLAGGVIDGKRLVSAEALNETHMPQTIIRLEGLGKEAAPQTNLEAYGMGWVVQDYRGQLLVSHAGGLNGFRSQVALLPGQNAGVVVLANAGRGFGVVALRNLILDQILGAPRFDWNARLLDLDQRGDRMEAEAKAKRDATRHAETRPSRELEAYTGTYSDAAYGAATVSLESGALVLHWNRLNVPLTHFQYDTFEMIVPEEGLDELVQFQLGTDGNVQTMTLFGQAFEAKR
ncbi:MAG TPA: serine hydrolase [Thermoanaerobaculia bacterium]|nr:serine hydrolase [Thermoanaerobaculia bacterium]